MKRTSQHRKELKTVQGSIDAWKCLEHSLDCISIAKNSSDSSHTEKMDGNILAIREHYKNTLNTKTNLAKSKELARIVVKKSQRALNLFKEEMYKSTFENSVTKDDTKPNHNGSAQRHTLLSSSVTFDYSKIRHNRISDPSPLEERTKGNDDEFRDGDILPFLFFASDSYIQPLTNVPHKESNIENAAKNSIKLFLLDLSSIYWIDSPLLDKQQLGFSTSLLSPTPNQIQIFMQKPILFYTTSAFIPNLVKKQIRENIVLEESSIAKEISTIIGEIQAHYQYLNAFFNSDSGTWKPRSLALNNRLISLNTTLNNLEAIAYRLMTSIGKSFEEHLNSFLLLFTKIYLILHTTSVLKLPVIQSNNVKDQNLQSFSSELIRLKTQQTEILSLVGKMFYSLKNFLLGYFKMQIAKVINKDFFKLKPDPFGKKDKTLVSFERLYGMLSLAKSANLNKFSPLCVSLSDMLSVVSSTSKWRHLVIQQDRGIVEACQKLELILKTNVMAAYLEVIY